MTTWVDMTGGPWREHNFIFGWINQWREQSKLRRLQETRARACDAMEGRGGERFKKWEVIRVSKEVSYIRLFLRLVTEDWRCQWGCLATSWRYGRMSAGLQWVRKGDRDCRPWLSQEIARAYKMKEEFDFEMVLDLNVLIISWGSQLKCKGKRVYDGWNGTIWQIGSRCTARPWGEMSSSET